MTKKKYWNTKATSGKELNAKEKTPGQSDD